MLCRAGSEGGKKETKQMQEGQKAVPVENVMSEQFGAGKRGVSDRSAVPESVECRASSTVDESVFCSEYAR